jgi:hypothetical protein
MSNRFVSAGKIGSSGETLTEAKSTESSADRQPLHSSVKSKEWEAVQEQLEAEKKRREEQRIKSATGEGEKSLYDVLQANKGWLSFQDMISYLMIDMKQQRRSKRSLKNRRNYVTSSARWTRMK